MIPALVIIVFAGYILFIASKTKDSDTEIIVGQKREIREIGERIQEVLDTEKIEKRKERQLRSVAVDAGKLLKSRRFKMAEKKYLSIVKADHKNLKAYQGLGLLYLEQKEWEGAAEAFEKVCEIDPTNDVAFNNLGLSYLNLNKYSEAITAFEKAVALKGNISHRYLNLALASEKAGEIKKQVAALEKVTDLEPKIEYLEKLFEAASLIDDKSAAKKALEKIIEIEPANLEAHRNLARFEK